MRSIKLSYLAILLGAVLLITTGCEHPQKRKITESFDIGWQFLKADATGAEKPEFNDAEWRTVNVPHDWSIEGPFDPNNPSGRGGAYLPSGISWYRKHFTLPAEYEKRRIFIEFDGVMANSDVWINGVHLGKRPFGYVSFIYELTANLNFGQDKTNVLAVRTDTSKQPASRWYTGAGIYRHVRFIATDTVHIEHWGVFVKTPKVTTDQVLVNAQTKIINQSEQPQQVTLQTTIIDPDGQPVQSVKSSQTIQAGKSADFNQDLPVSNPKLWDIENPVLYSAVSKVSINGKVVDDTVTPFGIRWFEFKADTGFWLNGKNMKFKGVCLHHDCGALGAAVPLRAWQRRLEKLKHIGVNAIRTAHNPVAPEFLDLCDRMGFLVMHEVLDTWTATKNHADFGYQHYFRDWWQTDTHDTVLRDRNHPSIIIYSSGNEIRDDLNSEQAFDTIKAMLDLYHTLDPTRPVTMALFRPNVSGVYNNGFADLLDVVGQNYRVDEILVAHRDRPERKIISTENIHDRESWVALRDTPFYSGQFLWTGIRYLGEADWPYITWSDSLFDRTGNQLPIGYQRQSWWSDKPMVHIVRIVSAADESETRQPKTERHSNWTPKDKDNYKEANIEAYSNCNQVELFLNGQSKGTKSLPEDASPRTWKMNFEEGIIKAVGKNNGEVAAVHELKTAGNPSKILLSADRSKLTHCWDDVAYLTVTIADANDVPHPWADNLITFELDGPGEIVAVDNGNRASHESFQTNQRRAFQGQCIAVIRATDSSGTITVTASVDELKDSTITIEATATKK